MSTEEKDPLFGTKGVKASPSKSRALQEATRLELSMTQETAKQLAETLTALAGNERGVKLDIHYGTKTTDSGSFLSSFFFAKKIQDPKTVKQTFKKKETGSSTADAAAAEFKKLG